MVAKPISKRDAQKQARCRAVIAAAEALIRAHGDVTFSMLDLARRAGVSPATPYNLFGTKSAILYALLDQSADRMFAAADALSGTSIDKAMRVATTLAEVLTSDPDFYRPLYAFLMGVPDGAWRPAFMTRAHAYWAAPFRAAADQPEPLVPADVLGDLMVTQALGCVEMWVHGDFDNEGLVIELRRACSAVLLGISPDHQRAWLMTFILAPRSIRIGA